MHRAIPRQRGVSLVELMIALLLGLLITGGVIQVFMGNRAAYVFNEGLARLQENARFALDTLSFRARMAGYLGCLSEVTVYNNLNSTGLAYDFENALVGFEAAGTAPGESFAAAGADPPNSADGSDWSPALPAELAGNVIPGSDVIVIRNVSAASHALVSPYTNASQMFVDAQPSDYVKGEIGVVSDCRKASVFQITNISANASGVGINIAHSGDVSITPGNTGPNWPSNQDYGEGAELLRAETWIYYVGARAEGGPPVLFQQRLQVNASASTAELVADELVEGVDTMQILYGIDAGLDGAIDQYVTANGVTDWSEVVTVRVALLIRTPEEYGTETDDGVYDVNGMNFDSAADRRSRQVLSTTIALRNRLP